ncbi:MAG TPA: pepsin/retropepsin-like aspartic protease family protein [Planctomycetota bacterium]
MDPRALLLLLSLGSTAVPAQDSLLARARAALGPWPAGSVQLVGRGPAEAGGLAGTVRVALAPGGRFRIDLESALAQSNACDGERVWTRDRSGLERPAELEDADVARVLGWVLSGHWTEARELALDEPARAEGEPPQLALALTGTPLVMTLALDPTTSLPTELRYHDDSGERRWLFEDWRAVGGRRLPHRWSHDDGSTVDRYSVATFEPGPLEDGLYRSAFPPASDVRFDPEADPELDVIRVASGHLLVEPWIEGEPVGMFIFDTGAGGMCIDPRVAEELGLEKLGEVLAVGIGGKTTTAFRRGGELQLGAVTWRDPVYVELDLAFLEPIFGRKVAGIIGYDLLARCVAEVETRKPYVALHDPARFTLTGAAWQELALMDNVPHVRARFEGEREGYFRLDTGANGTLTFHAPAVRELGLLEGRTLTRGFSGGVGGQAELQSGPLAWFELAGHRFENPTVSFSLAEHGAFTDRYTLGNVGQEFLAPFRLVLDYPGDRIAFVPVGK